MKILIKILDNKENESIQKLLNARFSIETYSKEFVSEIKKYECPFRLVNFLTKEEGKAYTYLKELDAESDYDMILDFTVVTEKIIEDKVEKGELLSLIPESYIDSTKHLNEYGVEQ